MYEIRSSTLARTAFIAGIATAGAAFWLAGITGPDVATADGSNGNNAEQPMALQRISEIG